MSLPQNFRTSIHGFNREDVVRYIETMTNKHRTQINQLTSENARLQEQLDAMEGTAASEDRIAELEKKLLAQEEAGSLKTDDEVQEIREECERKVAQIREELTRQLDEKDARIAELEELVAELKESEMAHKDYEQQELEAYRRAERAEREAKERADRIQEKLSNTLHALTEQSEVCTERMNEVSDDILQQIQRFASIVTENKEILNAATGAMKELESE